MMVLIDNIIHLSDNSKCKCGNEFGSDPIFLPEDHYCAPIKSNIWQCGNCFYPGIDFSGYHRKIKKDNSFKERIKQWLKRK